MSKIDINDYRPYREGTHPIFTSSENRCVHIGRNPGAHNVRQFKIDGGVFPNGTIPQRCDYLLLNDSAKESYYVELKGSNIPKATQQIDSTVNVISSSLPGYKIFRRIVYKSGTHKIDEGSVVKWKLRHRGFALIKHDKIEENIS